MRKLPPHVHTYAAQMDMTKTPAFRAVEELLKAQNTHMKLRREFEEAKLSEDIVAMKEVCIAQQAIPEILYRSTCCQHYVQFSQAFQIEENTAQHASESVMKQFNERIQKAEASSEVGVWHNNALV